MMVMTGYPDFLLKPELIDQEYGVSLQRLRNHFRGEALRFYGCHTFLSRLGFFVLFFFCSLK